MGRDGVRRDAGLKVRGTATYAFEAPGERPAYAHLVQASIPRGRVTNMDAAAAQAHDGVVRVLTVFNGEKLASTENPELAILQDDAVAFRGQIIGVVIAESSEAAREAAGLVRVGYHEQPSDSILSAERDDLYAPEDDDSFDADTSDGSVAAALAGAEVTVEETYSTAMKDRKSTRLNSSH